MCTVSVIVPVYKVEPYLHRCVDSILGQTFTDFELILVDDGSPDGCPAICDEYAVKDSRIHVIHQENAGLSAARNTGIDWVLATSDSQWISFVDSDDWIHPQYLSVLLYAALEHHVPISMCEAEHTNGTEYTVSEVIKKSFPMSAEEAYTSRYGMSMVAWGKLYRRDCFHSVRFPIGKLHEDVFTTYRLLFAVSKVAICDTPLYYYFYNTEGITHAPWTIRRLDEVEGHEAQLAFLNQRYPKAYLRELFAYVRILANHIGAIEKHLSTNDTNKKLLQKKLRRALFTYRKRISKKISGNEWLYEAAFPKGMSVYWRERAILRKLHILQ